MNLLWHSTKRKSESINGFLGKYNYQSRAPGSANQLLAKAFPLFTILCLLTNEAAGFEQHRSWTQTTVQNNDEPPQTTIDLQSGSHGLLGCLFQETLCNDDELCFDDSLFGRCITQSEASDDNDDLQDLSDIPESDSALLTLELEQLLKAGYTWDDGYTQCVMQNTIKAIQYDLAFDEADCDAFLPPEQQLGQEDLILVPSASDADLESMEETPEELDLDEVRTNVVPKKIPAALIPSDASSNIVDVKEQPDGSLLLEPNDRALLDDFVLSVNNMGDQEEDFDPVASYMQEQFPELDIYDTPEEPSESAELPTPENQDIVRKESSKRSFAPISREHLDYENFRAAKEALEDAIDDEEELEAEENPVPYVPIWTNRVEDNQQDNSFAGGRQRRDESIPTSYEDLSGNYDVLPTLEAGDYTDEYPDQDDQPDMPTVKDYYQTADSGPSDQYPPRALGLESNIFNRRERLDVKKPGPFYKNSANNFFLDKLMSTDYDQNSFDYDQKDNETDMGQVEYEMPLLAPPAKDKRNQHDLPLEQERPELPEEMLPEFVHIATKKRFNTWRQGSDFIKYLANEFGLPENAITDRLIENQHVQFHVAPNPGNVNAMHIAKRIDEDSRLKDKIDNQLGVEIDRAAAGHRDEVSKVLSPSNLNLLLLLVVTLSSLAALVLVGSVLCLVKRRRRNNHASTKFRRQELDDQERGKAQEEYKQLCRDWSRSGKKVDASGQHTKSSAKNKQLKNCDSKETESNRSSTSSWSGSGEEVLPNTTNMDISTGHMVLSYMEDHLKNKQRLETEWVGLCGYEAEPCATTIAFKAENKKKNRYPDKLPYDHNRVILNAMVNGTSSDYINASTVTDHDPRNPSYIVTQAPLSTTVADFWQMIWEQGCVVIVMLTKLQDNGHQLCQRYWPQEGSEQYHIFEVHLVSEHIWCEDYLVRSVYLKNTRTGETRTVTQFHFLSWPSHGVPSSTKALLEFRRKVNKSYRGRSCPIAVHCSDGVGRSGTYVLIDMVLNRMSKGCKEIDIAATLEHIRDQRGGMVQSRQQFEFCLMAVAEEVHAILKALPQ